MIDDDESPDTKELLRDVRRTFDPSPERVCAAREAIAARLGAAAAGAAVVTTAKTASGASSVAAGTATASTWSAVHWIGAGVLATVMAGGTYVATRDPARHVRPPAAQVAAKTVKPAATPKAIAPAAASAPQTMPLTEEAAVDRAAMPVQAAEAPALQRAAAEGHDADHASALTKAQRAVETNPARRPRAQRASAAPVLPPRAAHPRDVPKRQPATLEEQRRDVEPLAREIELLQEARGALAAGQARESLGLLDRYASRFPQGTLQQEALATRVLALCQAGRAPEARRTADQLVRIAPRSAHLIRLASSCIFDEGADRNDADSPASK
jgi:hypothetical protein